MDLFLIDIVDNGKTIHVNAIDQENRQHIIEVTEPRRTLYCVLDSTLEDDEKAVAIVKKQLEAVHVDLSKVSLYAKHLDFIHPLHRTMVRGRILVQVIFKRSMCAIYEMFELSSSTSSAGSRGGGGRRSRHPMIEWVLGKHISSVEYLVNTWSVRGWFRFKSTPCNGTRTFHKVPGASSFACIKPQPGPPPSNIPTTAIHWDVSKGLGSLVTPHGESLRGLALEDFLDAVARTESVIVLVHNKEDLPKELKLEHCLVIDTYQFAKELKPGKKDYTLDALTFPSSIGGGDASSSSSSHSSIGGVGGGGGGQKVLTLEKSMNLVQLLMQMATLTGQPCSKALSKLGRIEWILSRKFTEAKCVPPDKLGVVKKQAYQAGLVLEPRRGLHTNFIIYVDFKSLYPSICVENNICYSERGCILPPLLDYLVRTRKDLEEEAKTCGATAIMRMCLKLVANSIYGCLASPFSRFYSIELAEAITKAGRDALRNALRLIKTRHGLDAIYGDTDSLMLILPATVKDVAVATAMANEIVASVNEQYTYMELQFEGIIDKMALFSKKCYACVKNGTFEVKGLDMIKRGYSPCGAKACEVILRIMFEHMDNPSQALLDIYEYTNATLLPSIIDEGNTNLSDFVLTTQLSREPSQYESPAGLHFLQALANQPPAHKIQFRKGDFVHYLMTKTKGAVLTTLASVVSTKDLDLKWYISQITSMVDRLLNIYPAHKISNIFRDTSSKKTPVLSFLGPRIPSLTLSLQAEVEHLKYRDKLKIRCTNCKASAFYHGLTPVEQLLCASLPASLLASLPLGGVMHNGTTLPAPLSASLPASLPLGGGMHKHVTKKEIEDAVPVNIMACHRCEEDYDLAGFYKRLGFSEAYSFILSINVHRTCVQSACSYCRNVAWDALKGMGLVRHLNNVCGRLNE